MAEWSEVEKFARDIQAKSGTGQKAIKWALQEYSDDSDMIVAFLEAWTDGSVAIKPEWSEYRYWLTGEHEELDNDFEGDF